ncbi:thiamine phosphate synthase [Peribacillus sp. SCS-155]|uniref:thiamine phosphate synthase n=1 Tax=Peribacillus sedimenti TaxID=3115297 RepID=UPI0039064703
MKLHNTPDYSLYLVSEDAMPAESLLSIVEKSISGGVTVVQLREKHISGKDFYNKASQLKKLLDSYKIPLIINDRIDIALAVGAAGVHIGQDDIPAKAARKMLPDGMLLGVSVQIPAEAVQAEADGADYIGAGSVFPTATKNDAKLMEPGALNQICEVVKIPVVAIGGINKTNIATISDSGIAGAAVVSAITQAENPAEAASLLKKLLGK